MRDMSTPDTHEKDASAPTGNEASSPQSTDAGPPGPMQPPDAGPLQAAMRSLPAVDQLLKAPAVANLLAEFPREELLHAIRAVLDQRREALRGGEKVDVDTPSLALAVREKLHERARPHLRRVINATGIVLHTGLGRAPLAQEAIDAIADIAAGYCNLELDLPTGRRGDRHEHARELLAELTGAEDALVVNNNAAGTFLTLAALTAGREVIVSRGQLVEIGGSYRMPDIMAAAGCRMIEVGTTNRTHLYDYERAISDATAALLRVHTSNYRIQGFVESVSLDDLVKLARSRGLLVIDDLGSGLIDRELPWPDEGAVPGRPVIAQAPSGWAATTQRRRTSPVAMGAGCATASRAGRTRAFQRRQTTGRSAGRRDHRSRWISSSEFVRVHWPVPSARQDDAGRLEATCALSRPRGSRGACRFSACWPHRPRSSRTRP